ncbi:DESI1-like protein [Mya arenaria]|uniref:DESI1-like protein n=1 Tax=Mya arenaria TaxID=6604 RepID=A0ABY7DI91_MYAAR|nr:DESI1-like protein [Mya arenaria]
MASEGVEVKVYIYDLSRGLARSMSQAFLGKQIDGVWHTGIVVFGKEYFFGGMEGISQCRPGGTIMGQPDTIKSLGKTQIPYDMFMEYLADLSQSTFRGECYHLLNHNCNTFSSEVAQFLTGNDIPSHITGLPAEMIKPFLDSMSVQPSGGSVVFDQQPAQTSKPQHSKAAPSRETSHSQAKAATGTSQSPTRKSDPAKNVKGGKFEPAVYREGIPEESVWRKGEPTVSPGDLSLLQEIHEYLGQPGEPSWSLGRPHLTCLTTLGLVTGSGRASHALQLLTALILNEDMLHLAASGPSPVVHEVLHKFDSLTGPRKLQALKFFTNVSSRQEGHTCLLSDKCRKKLTIECVDCMLKDKTDHHDIATSAIALTYNLTLSKMGDDEELELGSALLNVDHSDLTETACYHLLAAIYQLMSRNEEVRGLAGVLGLDLAEARGKSKRLSGLCDSIQGLLSS